MARGATGCTAVVENCEVENIGGTVTRMFPIAETLDAAWLAPHSSKNVPHGRHYYFGARVNRTKTDWFEHTCVYVCPI